MVLLKSLHLKIVILALIPIFFVLGVITFVSYLFIENTAREVVQQRDAEIAGIAAARLSENLKQYAVILKNVATSKPFQSMNPEQIETKMQSVKNWLHIFDAGIFIYNKDGKAVWSFPVAVRYFGERFPVSEKFLQLKTLFRPVFSNIFSASPLNKDVILIAVPIIGESGQFNGAIAGFCSIKYSMLGAAYTRILEFKSGKSGYAYLVDGNGRVVYHRHSSLIGSSLKDRIPVRNVTKGMTGAAFTKRSSNEMTISGFAPVPGTDWGIITHEDWNMVRKPILDYTKLFISILWAGSLFSGCLVFFFIRRVLNPIRELTRGAERLAVGDFEQIRVMNTGDEVETLSRQFNIMTRALESSFDSLRKRVTELNQAQKDLKNSREKLDGIINSVADAMLMISDNYEIHWTNEKGRDYFGHDIEGKTYHEVLYRKSIPVENCVVAACFRDGDQHDVEIRLKGIDGKKMDFWCTVNVVLRSRTGIPVRVVLVCRNITEKRRLKAEVMRNAQLAALGELAAGVAHEINNPINGIINYSQILLDMATDSQQDTHIPKRIIKEGHRIVVIVSKLLSFARSGREKKKPVSILEIINDSLDLTRAMLKKDGIHIHLQVSDGLPFCIADFQQLQQVFLNVIENARYALNKKDKKGFEGKRLEIKGSLVVRDGIKMIRTIFVDFGTGISKDVIEKVCNPFFSTKPADKGTGLGLSISFGIIEDHHGNLRIRSREGMFTKVIIELPAHGG